MNRRGFMRTLAAAAMAAGTSWLPALEPKRGHVFRDEPGKVEAWVALWDGDGGNFEFRRMTVEIERALRPKDLALGPIGAPVTSAKVDEAFRGAIRRSWLS